MKFGVVIFPGSNCDRDLIETLSSISNEPVVELWHKDTDLKGVDFVFLPGGFSYGDYLRSGAIAKLSPIMKSVQEHAAKGGYVMGICNGFQILCESGLLPGALLHNNSRQFICKNVYLKPVALDLKITNRLNADQVLTIPIAHGEGKYYADAETLKSIEDNNQVIFRYCDENGVISDEANPNGSLNNIAGICNAGRNVFGMMPHPERCFAGHLHNTDGRGIFESIVAEVSSLV
ncbi:MAG: phosphoribosylformylglycinamidine synthase subunit PurQ [Bacteroidetes bacterium]|nr:phosphoribosylformylglycinamidine synthase subunit PurQ [Bacteroidota bacterium]